MMSLKPSEVISVVSVNPGKGQNDLGNCRKLTHYKV